MLELVGTELMAAGEMFMDIPPYMNVVRKGDGGPVALSVQDANVRHQREMWGEQSN